MKSNYIKHYASNTFYKACYTLTTGAVAQGFLLHYGMSEDAVSFYVALIQAVQIISMLIASKPIEKTKNVIGAYLFSVFPQIVLPITLLLLAVFTGAPVSAGCIIIFAAGIFTNIFQGIYNVLAYKVPYHIIDMSDYGRVMSISGIILGISGAAITALLSFLTGRFSYNKVMPAFFIFAAFSIIIASLIIRSFKDCFSAPGKKEQKKTNIFLYKPFYVLALPNFLRGFTSGVFELSAVIGCFLGIFSPEETAIMTLLSQLSILASFFTYNFFAKSSKDKLLIFIPSIALVPLFPTMIIGRTSYFFFALYFIVSFIINFIGLAVPVAVTKFVDYDHIGQYSAYRMLLHTLGVTLAGSITVFMLKSIGGIATLTLAGVCQLISGTAYFLFLRKYKITGKD